MTPRLTDYADAPARQGDWSGPLRRALAALPPGGGDVYVPGGDPYHLGSPVLVSRHNVRLIGDGPAASVLFGGRGGLVFLPPVPAGTPGVSSWYSPNPAGGLQIRPGVDGSVVFVGTPADQKWGDVRRGHGLPANAVVTVDGVAAAVPAPGPEEARRDR